jgi:tellurite resistance protein TerC
VTALADISSLPWVVFIAAILVFLALDLGVFHRHAHVVRVREALGWTAIWVACALAFAFFGAPLLVDSWTRADTVQFLTGYVIELSLSMDNVFVIALIFAWFRVPLDLQHRVLFWGILGALVMRGVMIGAGAVAVSRFEWVLYLLALVVLYSGLKMIFGAGGDDVHPDRNIVVRLARKLYPVTSDYEGQHFLTRLNGRRALTPLALVLVCVETSDLVFALDSIPAIFGVTKNGFIIFTSNVFAILGLRSLYFLLAGAIGLFRYLKTGLAVVLVFIGVKMLIDPHDQPPKWFQLEIPNAASLAIVGGIIAVSVVASLLAARRGGGAAGPSRTPPRS